MLATKRVAVTQAVWFELSDLRRPGETFSQLLRRYDRTREDGSFDRAPEADSRRRRFRGAAPFELL